MKSAHFLVIDKANCLPRTPSALAYSHPIA
jgi:hypothetical protein